jgi:uncharacterized protein YndB with AHSA1/START domain
MSWQEHSVWIKAQPEDVWRVYVDPRRIPDWETGSPVIEDVHGTGDEVGSTYVTKRGPAGARTTVIVADRPRHLVTRTDAYLGLRFDADSRLEAEGDGTRLDLRVETQWPRGRRLLGKVVELIVLNPREAVKELGYLKSLVEREAEG